MTQILVDADYLHNAFIEAVKLKQQLENTPELYEIANYVSGSLGALWFQGAQKINPAENDGIKCNPEDMPLPTISELNSAVTSLKSGLLMQEVAMNEVLDILIRYGTYTYTESEYVNERLAENARELKAKLEGIK